MKKSCISELLIYIAIVIVVIMLSMASARAYSEEFEQKTTAYVTRYNEDFLPWYQYAIFIAQEYGLSERDMARIIHRIKYETMFGTRGKGRPERGYNYTGIKCGRVFCQYQTEWEGIEATVGLYSRKYQNLTDKQFLRKWVGPGYSRIDYRDMQRTISLLSPL